MNAVKIGLLFFLLAGIFAMPGLTATQLVSVLGDSTARSDVLIQVASDNSTFVKNQDGQLTVSFTKPGSGPLIKLVNPGASPLSLRLSPLLSRDAALLSQSVDLSISGGSYRLYDHSVQPFNSHYELVLKPFQSLLVSLVVATDKSGPSYGTFTLEIN